jgi:PAS domain S-box-containing protein
VEAGFLAPIYCVLVAYLGMVAPWRYPVIMVLWSMVCFDSLVFLEYLDVLPHQSPLLGAPPGYTYPAINQLMTVLTVDAILGLMAFVSINIAGRLRSARARLRKQNMELEARVAGRTVELTAVNHSLRTSLEEQRRAEAALRESEEKYRGILENLEDGYWEADTGGRLTLVNDAMARLLGSDPAAPLGQRLKDWLDADTAAGVDATLDQIRRTREPARSLEWTLIPKDSRRRQVETSAGPILGPFGQVAGFRGIARDVTFRNQTQMELRQTRDFLQSIVHSSTDAIATVDLDGRIVYASPKCAELTGYPPEEFLGRRVMDFYGRGKEDAIGLRDALAQTGEIRDYELQLRCKNGQLLDISMSATAGSRDSWACTGISRNRKNWRPSFNSPRKSKPWELWPAVWPTISTTCSWPSRDRFPYCCSGPIPANPNTPS